MTKANVMVPRIQKKIYVVSCVWFSVRRHLFAGGKDSGAERTQQRPYVWRPEPGETEKVQLITAN